MRERRAGGPSSSLAGSDARIEGSGGSQLRDGVTFGIRWVIVVVAYFAAAKFGLSLIVAHGSATPIWAPTGIALACLLIFGPRMWVAVALGAFLANLTTPVPPVAAAGIAVGNTLEAVVGWYLLSRFGFDRRLTRVRDVTSLVAFAAIVSTMVSATIGVTTLYLTGAIGPQIVREQWFIWWMGDLMGALLVLPLLLAWTRPWADRGIERAWEWLLLAAVATACVGIGSMGGWWTYAFILFPALLWATLRFGQRGVTTTVFVLAVIALWKVLRGDGPLGSDDLTLQVGVLQGLLAVVQVSLLCLAATLSQQRRAERSLAHRSSELTEAQRVARIGSWTWDVGDDVVTWSDELFRIFGVGPDTFEATYQGFLDLVHPHDRRWVDAAVRRAMATGDAFEFEHRIVWPDGTERTVLGRGTVEGDGRGAVTRMFGTAQDITERRLEEDRFRTLLESAPDAVVIVDERGRIVLVNGQTEVIFGYERGELVGEPVEILMPEALRGRHAAHRAVYSGDPRTRPMGIGLDLVGRRRDGTEFPVEVGLSSIGVDGSRLSMAFVRDVADRREAEEELRAADTRRQLLDWTVEATEGERKRLSAELHDGPIQHLAAIDYRLEAARLATADGRVTEVDALIVLVQEEIRQEILGLRTMMAGLMPPALSEGGLAAALTDFAKRLEATADPPCQVEVSAEPGRLEEEVEVALFRVAQGALANVARHSGATHVWVTLRSTDSEVRLTVRDDGNGFEVSAETGDEGEHLGIVEMNERIVMLGGRFAVDSMPREGTTVMATLPTDPTAIAS